MSRRGAAGDGLVARVTALPSHARVSQALVAAVLLLLKGVPYPLAQPVIARHIQRSPRQTMRVLRAMAGDGMIERLRLPGEGNRGTAYCWRPTCRD